jgi:hypothetical protein
MKGFFVWIHPLVDYRKIPTRHHPLWEDTEPHRY